MIGRNVVLRNVQLGSCIIEDFCIIGGGKGFDRTIIGSNAFIRSHTVIYYGNTIGKNFNTGNKTNIREYCNIGDKVSIGTLTVVEHHVEIGNNVRIHSQAFIPEYTILEDDCWIGPNVVFTNAKYPNSPSAKDNLSGVHVMSKVVIGANCTILPGITLEESCIVGAGSVVTKDVPSGVVVAGNPAKIINNVQNIQAYGE